MIFIGLSQVTLIGLTLITVVNDLVVTAAATVLITADYWWQFLVGGVVTASSGVVTASSGIVAASRSLTAVIGRSSGSGSARRLIGVALLELRLGGQDRRRELPHAHCHELHLVNILRHRELIGGCRSHLVGDGETDRHQSVEGDTLAVERELLHAADGVGEDTRDGSRRERRVVFRHVLRECLHVVGTVGDDAGVILAIRMPI